MPFTRADLLAGESVVLHRGKWGNATVIRVEHDGVSWAVKDFSGSPWGYRLTLGRWLMRRELRFLQALAGIEGLPDRAFRVDVDAFACRYVEGQTLKQARRQRVPLARPFFRDLERLVQQMHRRGVAHLDLRYASNILVTPERQPVLLDFQTAVSLRRLPRGCRRLARLSDLSGVYKWWVKTDPASLSRRRLDLLRKANRVRRFWMVKGYVFKPSRWHGRRMPDIAKAGRT